MPYISGNDQLVHIGYHLAQLSHVAYEDQQAVHQAIASHYAMIGFLEHGWGFVASNDDVVTVVFTGTRDLFDMLVNVNVDLASGFGGRVHQGFAALAENLWSDVVDGINQLRNNSQEIWLTGHSLGGAVAILTGRLLYDAGVAPAQIHTFGAPKVGDASFARQYPANLARFENSGDSVPSLPPFDEYQAAGVQCFLTTTNQLYVPDGTWADNVVSGIEMFGQGLQIVQRLHNGHGVTKVLWEEMATKYHNLERYVEKLSVI